MSKLGRWAAVNTGGRGGQARAWRVLRLVDKLVKRVDHSFPSTIVSVSVFWRQSSRFCQT